MTSKDKKKQTCFVIMPISIPEGYEEDHFLRVYKYLIKPACESIDLSPIRADDIKSTNYIVLDILKRTIESEIALCDLSSRNPNVFYELGIRQAFNLPVVLIKDKLTPRVFDIQGFRTYDYDESLRVDSVEKDIAGLGQALKETLEQKGQDINSLVKLLGLKPAEIGKDTQISPETSLILSELSAISKRLANIEQVKSTNGRSFVRSPMQRQQFLFGLPSGDIVKLGEAVYDSNEKLVGYFKDLLEDGVLLQIMPKGTHLIVSKDDDLFKQLRIRK